MIFVAARDTVVADLATGKNRGWPGWSLAWPDDRWGPLVGSDGCAICCWALLPSFTLLVALGKRGRHLGFESGIPFASPDGLGVCWAPLTGSEGPQRWFGVDLVAILPGLTANIIKNSQFVNSNN